MNKQLLQKHIKNFLNNLQNEPEKLKGDQVERHERVVFYQGWTNKENYVVVIRFTRKKQAKFVTAFEIDSEENLALFTDGPDWTGKDKWI